MNIKKQSLEFIDVTDAFGNVVSDNVTDVRSDRAELTYPKNRWVFPTFPDKANYNNYPITTVIINEKRYINQSPGNFLTEEYDAQTNTYKEYYYKMVEATLHYFILTEKKTGYNVDFNGTSYYLSEKPLNSFIVSQILHVLNSKREDLLKVVDDYGYESESYVVEENFENNEYTWASEIRTPIKYKEVWIKEFEDGELIADYTLNKTIIQEV